MLVSLCTIIVRKKMGKQRENQTNNLIPFVVILIQFDKQIESIAILEQAFSIFLQTKQTMTLITKYGH